MKDLSLSDEAINTFNDTLVETLNNANFANAPDKQKLDDAFEIARETLPDKPQHIKKPWISETTYSLIKEKHHVEDTKTQRSGKTLRKSERAKDKTGEHTHMTL